MSSYQRYEQAKAFFSAEKLRLAGLGIRAIGLFGSVARGEAGPESDIDVLIDLGSESTITLFELIALEQEYTERLNQKVDLVIKSDLKPNIGRQILNEVQYV